MKKRIDINVGGFHASRQPTVIHTLLGSCVAVCLYDRASSIGGMNHILLPGKADLKHFDNVTRYAINAMELLINKIMGLGGKRHNLVAKVFGGAHIVPEISPKNGMGTKNSQFVLSFLQTESIAVVSKDIGGRDTRKIYFHTDTGDVFLKRIRFNHSVNIAHEERKVLFSLRKKAEKSADVILFDREDSKVSNDPFFHDENGKRRKSITVR